MKSTAGRIFVCILFTSNSCLTLRFGSFLGDAHWLNYTTGCQPSFECDLMLHLCEQINNKNNCRLTMIDSPPEEITALENYYVDIIVGRFKITSQKTSNITFVRPYYYSSGAQLFTLPDEDVFLTFESLLSYPVCMDLDYYFGDFLSKKYGFIHFPAAKTSFLKLVQQGYCVAVIADSGFMFDGLIQSNATSIYHIPYAVAISKTPGIDNLEIKVQNALLGLFQNGKYKYKMSSQIEQLESEYLLPQGIQKNKKLASLVDAINSNSGNLIDKLAEDKIWNVVELKEQHVVHQLNKFQSIVPGYDIICKRALDTAHESYINGTDVHDLPMMYVDRIHFTYIFNVTQYDNLLETAFLVSHPFLSTGIEAAKKRNINPQRATLLLIYQGFLVREEYRTDGNIFITIAPFDTAPIVCENETLTVPTRVLSTIMFLTLQGRREDEGSLFIVGCRLGELRNW
eukprot:TRINITY_DN1612_c0_g1_i10.p1 TRINITY_DN1612_c0_g1~~TRINITY_DN1612_c0_g1_i10.p1  ORF type:complete len:456 (-),score=31.84 TRINITY_DN1612_c0_g1_i10:877-2244(-)